MHLVCAVIVGAALGGSEPRTSGNRESAADRAAESLYLAARRGYRTYRAAPERFGGRAELVKLARRFAAIQDRHPQSTRAIDALFTAARLYGAAWQEFRRPADADAAAAAFEKVCSEDSDHRLCDDARFALAGIRAARGEVARARRALAQAAAGGGDRAAAARRRLAALGGRGRPALTGVAAREASRLQAATAADGPTIAAQMGLKIRRVVIDPGHGGPDTGALGPSGLLEKDAALDLALGAAAALEEMGYEVLLTRDQDEAVSLEKRVAMANAQAADLLVSVHLNSAPQRSLAGAETFTLDVSSDRHAQRLAARENAPSERRQAELAFILADLATRANAADSRRLAEAIQRALGVAHGGAAADRGVKQALFHVLLGARMPAVLVEAAFLTNPDEERRLRDPEFRDRLARGIADGVARFVGDREELAQAGIE